MNFFELVIKQMRQRALSTWLTLLSVLLGVGLAVAIMIFQREGDKLFGQSDYGYDLVVGPGKGSRLQIVLNTVYHLDQSPGTIPYSLYGELSRPRHPFVRAALPYAVGDEYEGHRVVGTLPHVFPIDDKGYRFDLDKPEQIADALLANPRNTNIMLLAPVSRAAGQSYRDLFAMLHRLGFVRLRIDGQLTAIATPADFPDILDDTARSIEAVVDDLIVEEGIRDRLIDSISLAQSLSNGPLIVRMKNPGGNWRDRVFPTEPFQYRIGQQYAFAAGRPFHPEKFEAVIGSEVARKTGLQIGSKLKVQHGVGDKKVADEHDETWTVVGILQQTKTANDGVVLIPLISYYAISEHGEGIEEMYKLLNPEAAAATAPAAADPTTAPATAPATAAAEPMEDDEHAGHDHSHAYHLHGDMIHLEIEPEKWRVSAILLRTRGGFHNRSLMWQINNQPIAQAVTPAEVMREFFDSFLKGIITLFLIISILVVIVAAASILVSIYNSVSARRREIAILRALGATRKRILLLICFEAGLIGLLGGLAGLVGGHLLAAAGSLFLQSLVGQGIGWLAISTVEAIYLGVVVVLAVLAGLVPALKAYRTPVATNLVAG